MDNLIFELDLKRAEQARNVALAALEEEFAGKAAALNKSFDKDIEGMRQARVTAPASKPTWNLPRVDSFVNEVW